MTSMGHPGSDGGVESDRLHGFIDFYKTTVRWTLGTAHRAAGGDKDVAEDATQEAYVVMWKLWLDDKKPEGDNYHYVVGIAVRKVADFYRFSSRHVPLEEEHDCGADENGHAEVLDTMTHFAVVRNCLDRQPSQRRAVGALYLLEEFNYTEIAEALGIRCSTVRTHVQRLRKELRPLISRSTLDDQGGES